jgi:type VI secretion system protein
MNRLFSTAALLLCACMVAGCGMFGGGPKAVKPGWDSVNVTAAPDANGNSALAVDVVLVKERAVLESLMAMPAKRWFEARDGLQRTYPEGLTVLSAEITPGQTIRFARERFKGDKAWAALAFANYATPGEHRQSLPLKQDQCVLQLDAQDFAAITVKH